MPAAMRSRLAGELLTSLKKREMLRAGERFQNEHVQSALNEITWLVRHRRIPPEVQEEEYTSPTDCQEEESHDSLGFCSQGKHGRDLCRSGGTGKAEAAKLPDAGISPSSAQKNERHKKAVR